MYTSKREQEILSKANCLLEKLWQSGKIAPDDENIIIEFNELIWKSNDYSVMCREKATKCVLEKRKTDKSYGRSKRERDSAKQKKARTDT